MLSGGWLLSLQLFFSALPKCDAKKRTGYAGSVAFFETTSSTRRMAFTARLAWLRRRQKSGKLKRQILIIPARILIQMGKRRRVSAKTEEKNLGLTTVDIDRRSATTSALEHTAASAAFLLVLYISLLFSTYILALCDMQAMKYLYEPTLEHP